MKIYCITPINNPKFLKNAIDNFKNQLHVDKHLILVLNGPIIDYITNDNQITVLKCDEENIGKARNVALDYLKNGEWFSNFDADDYYSKYYLLEVDKIIEENLHIKDLIIGKLDFQIIHNNDIYEITGLKSQEMCHGPTISTTKNHIRYNEISLGEDIQYINDRLNNNATLIHSSIYNFTYNKDNNNCASRTNINQLLNQIKAYNSINNIDIKIVKNGKLIWKTGDDYSILKLSDLINF
jgi:hypothetical protein